MGKDYKGYFITIEGGDGVGKTTAINALKEKLIKNKIDFFLTREPGGSRISESIRNIILDKNNKEEDPKTEALLYAASRRQHLVEVIIPKLKKGELVISDRYIDSSLAYQGYARNIGIDEIYNLNLFAIDSYLPDLTFFLDLSPEIGLKRILNNHRENDRLDNEKEDFHFKVYEGYQKVIKQFKERFHIVDASKTPDEISQEMLQIIKNLKWMKKH